MEHLQLSEKRNVVCCVTRLLSTILESLFQLVLCNQADKEETQRKSKEGVEKHLQVGFRFTDPYSREDIVCL